MATDAQRPSRIAWRRRKLAPSIVLAVACASYPASAQEHRADAAAPSAADAEREARARFDRGLELFEKGEHTQALAEFTRAYELAPNSVVLLNIGLVYAATNRPVDAVATLDKVLEKPGSLSAARLEQAQKARVEQARRIATLKVSSNAPAVIEVDGVEAGRTPPDAALRLTSGRHVIAALAPGYMPIHREVTLAEGTTERLGFDLIRAATEPAHLRLTGGLPGVSLRVDGVELGKTPFDGAVAIAPGARTIELSRRGYVSTRREVKLDEGRTLALEGSLPEDPSAPLSARGRVVLQVPNGDVQIELDGVERGFYREPLSLMVGPHAITLSRVGFEPRRQLVEVPAGRDVSLVVSLSPTPETLERRRASSRTRKFWGVSTAGAGALFAGAGAFFYLSGRHQLSQANADIKAYNASTQAGGACDPSTGEQVGCSQQIQDASDRADRGIRNRTIGVVGLVLGGAAFVVGSTLFLSAGASSDEAVRVSGSF